MTTSVSDKVLMQDVVNAALRFGTFTLRSGQQSSFYMDKYQLFASPGLLHRLLPKLAFMVPISIDVLAGLELGGVPLAMALSLHTTTPAAFVRKQAKTYGTCLISEGAEVRGKNVCVIEDVITTGGQVLESVKELRALGAQVHNVICVINRGGEASYEKFKEHDLRLRSLFDMEQLQPLVDMARKFKESGDGL
jgi:orotate phosphoribosyltransferase